MLFVVVPRAMVEVEKKIYCHVARVIHSAASWIRESLPFSSPRRPFFMLLQSASRSVVAVNVFADFLAVVAVVVIVTSLLTRYVLQETFSAPDVLVFA